MDDQWEQVFKERLSDYQDTPPADALPHILREVNPRPAWSSWYGRAAAAIGLLLLSWGGWQWLGYEPSSGRQQPTSSPTEVLGPEAVLRSEQRRTAATRPVVTKPAQEHLPPSQGQIPHEQSRESGPLVRTPQRVAPQLSHRVAAPNAEGQGVPLASTYKRTAAQAKQSAGFGQPEATTAAAGTVAPLGAESEALPLSNNNSGVSPKNRMTQPQRPAERFVDNSGISRTPHLQQSPVVEAQKHVQGISKESISTSSPETSTSTSEPIASADMAVAERKIVQADALSPKSIGTFSGQLPAIAPVAAPSASPPIEIARQRSDVRYYLSLMPLYGYQSIRTQSTENALVENLSTASSLSAERIGWRLQTGIETPLSTRLRGRVGLALTQQSRQISYQVRTTQVEQVAIVEQNAQSVTLVPTYRRTSQNLTQPWFFAGARTNVMYSLSGESFEHFLTVGAEVGAKISGKARFNSFLNLGYGFSQSLGQGITLRVEPTLNYALTSHLDEAQHLRIRPYSVGINFGLVWGL